MKRSILAPGTAVAVLLLAAPPSHAHAQQAGVEEAVLTMSLGDSLVAVDSLRRSEERLVSRVTYRGSARLLLDAELTPDGGIESLHIVIRPWDRGPEGEPAVDVTVRPVGELLMLDEPEGAVLREIEFGTFPYVSPSLALLEQELMLAREVAGGDTVTTVPVWTPYGGTNNQGQVWTDTVRFLAPDSVRVSGWQDVVSTWRLDDSGRIVSGRMEPTGYTVRREAGN